MLRPRWEEHRQTSRLKKNKVNRKSSSIWATLNSSYHHEWERDPTDHSPKLYMVKNYTEEDYNARGGRSHAKAGELPEEYGLYIQSKSDHKIEDRKED